MCVLAGHPDTRFMELCNARKGKFKSRDKVAAYKDDFSTISLHGEVFPTTICHSKCELVVNGVKCNA
jgi:hypothetical protein